MLKKYKKKKNYSPSGYFLPFTEGPRAPVEDPLHGDTSYIKPHSHVKCTYRNMHWFSLFFLYFVHLATRNSLPSRPVGLLFNMATSRININIF